MQPSALPCDTPVLAAVPGAATRSQCWEHYLFPRQAGFFKPPESSVSSGSPRTSSPFLLIPIKGRLGVTVSLPRTAS